MVCRVEIRSVNHRHFKCTIRTREGFHLLEPRLEAALRERIRRGSLQVSLEVTGTAVPSGRRLDREQLAAYLDDWESFCDTRGLPTPQAIDPLLGLPGVLQDSPPDTAAVEASWPVIQTATTAALDQLDAMRRAEGDALVADLEQACQEIDRLVTVIRQRVPEVVAEHRLRLLERVAKVLESHQASLSENDLIREVALLADRSDISEELVRLESHVEQFRSLLADTAPGRSLDFLAQELGREANTIGSKSVDVTIAHAVVDLKSQIERIREQAANIE
ncbi:MAG: YicC family protein [Planctomycetia bacterium]|nr:YicC family protein [Planctomycetia bacterium]